MSQGFFLKKEGLSLQDLSDLLGWRPLFLIEKTMQVIDGTSIEHPQKDHLCFVKNKKALSLMSEEGAFYLVHASLEGQVPFKDRVLLSEDPEGDFTKVLQKLYPAPYETLPNANDPLIPPEAILGENVQIGPGAVVSRGVKIGDHTVIGANVVIGPYVEVGHHSVIHAGATIMCAVLGDHVVVHPNASIGQAGFGFVITAQGMLDTPQIGRVVIENDVNIGSNTTIDRGGLKDTVIGAHTRIDNLVQIAHNVQIGRGCVIVSQTGIAGSSSIGDYSVIGGQVGIADNVHIGKGVKLASKSGVMKDIPDGQTLGGVPAVPIEQWHRSTITLARLVKEGKK